MEKLNIAELLKDCPSGMELDSTIVGGLYFDEVTENNMIKCYTKRYYEPTSTCNSIYFYSDGSYLNHTRAKCVIFPKGKTTWEGFQRPFKDGDVVTWEDRGSLVACIYKERKNTASFNHHIALYKGGLGIVVNGEIALTDDELCLATEEEKQKLFQAIKDNGYKWNPETKTLGKLEVNKFDITTLKPFDKVLVRDNCQNYWAANLYSHYMEANEDYHFATVFGHYRQCIPYESNEHLLGTTYDCEVYFKTWA